MFIKKIKDQLIKLLDGPQNVPRGLFELQKYFRLNGAIEFTFENIDGHIVAISKNFVYGKIITEGKDKKEAEKNIPDAILTSFEVPSSYAKEAGIYKVGSAGTQYAIA